MTNSAVLCKFDDTFRRFVQVCESKTESVRCRTVRNGHVGLRNVGRGKTVICSVWGGVSNAGQCLSTPDMRQSRRSLYATGMPGKPGHYIAVLETNIWKMAQRNWTVGAVCRSRDMYQMSPVRKADSDQRLIAGIALVNWVTTGNQ